jgi:hypothetical protein
LLRRFKYVRELEQQNGRLRDRLARFSNMHGAGPPGAANCDTPALQRFTELERDYRALEQDYRGVLCSLESLREKLRKLALGV